MSIRTAIKNGLRKMPVLDKVIARWEFKQKYKTEIALYDNKKVQAGGGTSIIHFSINKAATQHIKKVLRELAAENDLIPVHLHEYAFKTNLPYLDQLSPEEMIKFQHVFKQNGFLYTVFGGMINNIKDLDSCKLLLTVRDPRDVLVSKYYSWAFSHPLPPKSSEKRKDFLNERSHVKSLSIDQYVLEEAPHLKSVFLQYRDHLLRPYEQEHVNVLKYEHMTANYADWLDSLAGQLELSISKPLRTKLITANEQHALASKSENKYRHRRKGQPGDHKKKLKPETISILNEQLKPVLEAFGYTN